MDVARRSLVVKVTCGAEAPERCTQAWTVAATAVAAGVDVTVWLTGDAVWCAVAGRVPVLQLAHSALLADLVEGVRAGGRVVVCTQCAARRELTPDDLVDGATIAGAASFVEAVLAEGVQALVY